ncbi:MAG TPA: hypothetical protein VKB93_07205 [Thermoanaerobaculia bacterium]|nr:hypothetical protein [Thermoanaerobaculia bacterium]
MHLAVALLAAVSWLHDSHGTARRLNYAATATFLGQEKPVTVQFYCDPTRTKDSVGALGFTLEIAGYESLKAFHFDDFEGPDAPASERALLEAATVRNGKTTAKFHAATTGWISVRNGFAFEVSAVFDRASPAKDFLRALTEETDAVRITITDTRDARVKLLLTIPMKGTRADFKWLLAELKK